MNLLRYAVALPAYFTGCICARSIEWFERGAEDVALAHRKEAEARSTTANKHNAL